MLPRYKSLKPLPFSGQAVEILEQKLRDGTVREVIATEVGLALLPGATAQGDLADALRMLAYLPERTPFPTGTIDVVMLMSDPQVVDLVAGVVLATSLIEAAFTEADKPMPRVTVLAADLAAVLQGELLQAADDAVGAILRQVHPVWGEEFDNLAHVVASSCPAAFLQGAGYVLLKQCVAWAMAGCETMSEQDRRKLYADVCSGASLILGDTMADENVVVRRWFKVKGFELAVAKNADDEDDPDDEDGPEDEDDPKAKVYYCFRLITPDQRLTPKDTVAIEHPLLLLCRSIQGVSLVRADAPVYRNYYTVGETGGAYVREDILTEGTVLYDIASTAMPLTRLADPTAWLYAISVLIIMVNKSMATQTP